MSSGFILWHIESINDEIVLYIFIEECRNWDTLYSWINTGLRIQTIDFEKNAFSMYFSKFVYESFQSTLKVIYLIQAVIKLNFETSSN